MDSSGRALSPTDSVASLSSFRPSLVWLFKHIRRKDQDVLEKEDLRKLLGVDIDNEQLDEAFENLDMDGDGCVSLDEFIGGFARFLREAPVTPKADNRRSFRLRNQGERSGLSRKGSKRRSRLIEEEFSTDGRGAMEMNGDHVEQPSENFSRSMITLSSHNK